MFFKKLLILILISFFPLLFFSQTVKIHGTVKDENNIDLPYVNIFTKDNKIQDVSDSSGRFSITVPSKYKFLYFQFQNDEPVQVKIPANESSFKMNITLGATNKIEDVVIEADKVNATGIISVEAKISEVLPSISGGIESLIKTELGVSGARNELSSKYSVRGGSFDENLVYVNGIEIYRPQLIRAGQQEGLSFINPSMVSEAKFSSGGFEAKYGGKLSSVLDITYKHALKNEFSASASLLGGSLFYQRLSKNKKLSILSGLRYKTTKYLLNSLETSGDYNPRFIDFQTYISYIINRKYDIRFLANMSDSRFNFIPKSGVTNFGSIEKLLSLNVYYTGQETDQFYSNTAALSFNFHPDKNLNYSFNLSAYSANESEKFDIIGFYDLNQLNNDIGSDNAGDSILNLGNGAYMQHARNCLLISGLQVTHSGYFKKNNHYFNWGIIYKHDSINDKIDEWNLLDSASYSIPQNKEKLDIFENIKSKNKILNNRFTAYLQDKYLIQDYLMQYEFIGGLRVQYNTLAHETLWSPRIAIAAKSLGKNKHVFRFSSGIYYQPVFYREIRKFDGSIAADKTAQKSVHFVLGHQFQFHALGRNMKLYTEIYYKKLNNIIPFEMDNIRVKYYADVRTSGYVKGIDTKIRGDFVPGIDSWFSLSFLKTEEKITDFNNDTSFYIPRPTDQRVTANLFVQDYLPGNKRFKVFMNFVFGTGFPFGEPKNIEEKAEYRSFSYQRVDLGASAVLINENKKYQNKFFNYFKSVWLTVEVFNMLDIENTISYRWIHVVPNSSIAVNNINNNFPVPYNLTGRRFNLKLSIKI
ncbi:MAG: TonB-dependent receptor plug domain-containing protein [Chlorobi bacterium]|nr:TonB-dependent receptor plug domain-containing protein [Chlorobiota bacterium]